MATLRFLCPLEFLQPKQLSASIWSNWISLCCWVWELSPAQSPGTRNFQSLSCHGTSTGKHGTAEHGNLFSCAPTDRMSFSTVSSRNVQLGCPWIFTFFILIFFLCSNNFAKSAHNSISELSSLCMFCGSVCTGRKQNSYRPWAKGKYSHFNKSESSEGHLNVSWKILSISASVYLIDTQLLLPSLRDVTLSSSWTPASGILAVLLSSRSKIKYYSAL